MIIILAFQSVEDKEKFEYIYQTYKRLLLYKAYNILKDFQLAEDAVSEAMIRIYKNIDKIDDPNANKAVAFIVTIVKNTALTLYHRVNNQQTEPVEESIADSFDLENFVLSEISAESIYSVIDRLNEELKSVFLLKFAYDLSHKEIGNTLNITENNMTVRLHRAKKKISELLRKEEKTGE